jgi:hypothetical protein
MKKTILLLGALALTLWASATHYTSLANGNWSDAATVWSTDGLTPCGCAPLSNFADQVTVRHHLNMVSDLTVMAAGSLEVQADGMLSNSGFQLTVDGMVNNYGELQLKSLKVDPSGSFVNAGLVRIVLGPVNNEGSMIINGPFEVMEGILENADGGYMAIGPNVRVVVMTDDVFNKGTMEFMGGGACLTVQSKNFYNQNPNGSVEGYGGVFVQGDLTSHGSWQSGVNWCAVGALKGTGVMPPENCGGVCTDPYPVVLSDFRAELRADFVNLAWRTQVEQGMSHFVIEKSLAGETCTVGSCSATTGFVEIGQVPAQGNAASYYFTDRETTPGVLLYRLRMVETNGNFVYSPVVSVNLQAGQPGLLIYPNPTNGDLNIRLTGTAGTSISVEIYDISGRRIWEHKGSLANTQQELIFSTCDLASGTYLVKYRHNSKEEVRKLVVQK